MRECGNCTMCCKLLEIPDVPSKIDEVCKHCDMGQGCMIYESRPDPCREYQCMWSQMERVGDELRPDRCGVIFDRIGDSVICARIERDGELTPLVEAQIRAFGREGFSVMLFKGKGSTGFLNPNHTKEYVMGVVRDRSELH